MVSATRINTDLKKVWLSDWYLECWMYSGRNAFDSPGQERLEKT